MYIKYSLKISDDRDYHDDAINLKYLKFCEMLNHGIPKCKGQSLRLSDVYQSGRYERVLDIVQPASYNKLCFVFNDDQLSVVGYHKNIEWHDVRPFSVLLSDPECFENMIQWAKNILVDRMHFATVNYTGNDIDNMNDVRLTQ